MSAAAPLIALAAVAGVIYWLGGSGFGRAQTQAWIERTKKWPALYRFLNRHHGAIRASGHYFEFGGLFLVMYWIYDSFFGSGIFAFDLIPATIIAVICAIAAVLDELHQLQSGTRQFRRLDFLHSCCGIVIAAAIVLYLSIWRGV